MKYLAAYCLAALAGNEHPGGQLILSLLTLV